MIRLIPRAAVIALVLAATPAVAQTHNFNLPGGALSRSAVALGDQARVSIALDPSIASVQVRSVRGRMSAEQALRRMLAGTVAKFVRVGPASYRVIRVRDRAQPRTRARPTSPPTMRANENADRYDEIVITASKRGLPVRNYPGPTAIVQLTDLPITAPAQGSEALTRHIAALGSTHLGPGRDKLFIRAIADSSFTGQTQATVGQYLGEARLNYNAPDPGLRLYDLESVELLPGPQGTLYGAGTIGGVLRALPIKPRFDDLGGTISFSAAATEGGSPSGEIAGTLNFPLIEDRVAVRAVGYGLTDGGYIDDVGRHQNDVNRTKIAGGRVAIRSRIGPDFEIQLGVAGQRIAARDSQYAELGARRWTRSTMLAEPFRNSFVLGNLLVEGELGPYRLVATATHADHKLDEWFDSSEKTAGPSLFRQRNTVGLATAEVRVSDEAPDGTGWLAGLSVVRNERQLERLAGPPGGLVSQPTLTNRVGEETVFGEATLPVASGVMVTGGARLSHVRSTGTLVDHAKPEALVERSGAQEWQFMPALALSAEINERSNFYLRYQEGYRPGGLIVFAGQTQLLRSDDVSSVETGFRFRPRSTHALAGSLALSYTEWRNVQADLVDNTGLPTTINLGDGDLWTLDAQVQAKLSDRLHAQFSGLYNLSSVTSDDFGIIIVDDASLPNVPRFSIRAAIDYSRPLTPEATLRLMAWARYVGESRLGIGPNLDRKQGEYLDTGIESQLAFGRYKTFLAVTNLLNSASNRFALGSIPAFGIENQTTPMRPRTIRIGIDAAF